MTRRRIPRQLMERQQEQRKASDGMRELERVQAQVFRVVVNHAQDDPGDLHSDSVNVRIPRTLLRRARMIAALFNL